MKRFLTFTVFALSLFFPLTMISCQEETPEEDTYIVSGVQLPSSLDVYPGMTVKITVLGTPPAVGDEVLLVSSSGEEYTFPVSAAGGGSFSFVFDNEEFTSGSYTLHLKRGTQSIKIGSIQINIVYKLDDFTPDEGVTVYGIVTASNKPVQGVVVSDGYEVAVTDKDGVYQLKSEKKHGYVFMSIPSGYNVGSDGIRPRFYTTLTGSADEVERADFYLEPVDNNDYVLLVFGDMHLANRSNTNDISQFFRFTNDLNDFLASNRGKNIYALTLGDMTWDLYWYENNYTFSNYLNTMNTRIGDLQVFHTIGNHDHDMKAAGDWDTVVKYKKEIAPTYYSFNLGKYHYVVLDDILCTNTSGGESGDRHYIEMITSEQIDWLEKDLAYVDKNTPVIVSTHAPLYKDDVLEPSTRLLAVSTLFNAFDGYEVHYLTGHTHRMLNVDKLESDGHFEHNAGAICADWWWSYKESEILISTDGCPGGYSVFEISGTNMKWRYKATDFSDDYQFRTYDLNNVHITNEKYIPNATETQKKAFEDYVDAYPENKNDEVLINVWNWDPEWEVRVTENGKDLDVERVVAYDPLHIIAYTAKRLNKGGTTSASFPTNLNNHFFKVTASAPDTDLEITVTDRFGKTYTEIMERPKTFDIKTYLQE